MRNFFMLMVFSKSWPFSSNFENGRIIVLPLSRNRFLKNASREELELLDMFTWTSLYFSRAFFARSSPSTHRNTYRNWASDISVESCCKHANFPCWSFFHTCNDFRKFHLKFIQYSSWTSCCFQVELLWRIFVCNFLIHLSVLHKWYLFCTNLSHNIFF